MLARITAGQSLAVHTLPGTGGTQTVINAVGALVRDGKRVLVVSARRSTLEGVRHRLAGIGLPGLAVSPRDLQRDLIRAIGRNEKAEQPKVADIDDALVRLRGVLRDYRSRGDRAASRARRLGARRAPAPRRTREPHAGAERRSALRHRRALERLAPARTKAAAAARGGGATRRVPLRTRRLALVRRDLRDDRARPARRTRSPASCTARTCRHCSSAATSSSRRRACARSTPIARARARTSSSCRASATRSTGSAPRCSSDRSASSSRRTARAATPRR